MFIEGKKLSKYYGDQTVLKGLTFRVAPEHKIALTGINGVGKSTLLSIIAGEEGYSNGTLQIKEGIAIGYLPQTFDDVPNTTVKNFLLEDEQEIEDIDAFLRHILICFAGLGLEEEVLEQVFETLSSGQKVKVFLTKLLVGSYDVLLLDEPTNNLDLPARLWLEQYLQNHKAAMMIVSHDVSFLHNTTNKIFELDWSTEVLHVSNASYKDYIKEKQLLFESQLKNHKLDKNEVSRLQKVAKWYQAKGEEGKKWKGTDNDKMLQGYNRNRAARSFRTSKVVYDRMKRKDVTDKPEEREIPDFSLTSLSDIAFEIEPTIELKDAVFSQGTFSAAPITLSFPFKKRICFIGENGIGKSTLLKGINGQLDVTSGERHVSETVRIAYVMQEHDSLPREERVLDYFVRTIPVREELEDEAVTSVEREAAHKKQLRRYLESQGFVEAMYLKTFGVLSPGERLQILFAYFALDQITTLILDEPTNHLDTDARFSLEHALKAFSGTVIAVSHDRAFIDAVHFDATYRVHKDRIEEQSLAAYVKESENKVKKMMRMLK